MALTGNVTSAQGCQALHQTELVLEQGCMWKKLFLGHEELALKQTFKIKSNVYDEQTSTVLSLYTTNMFYDNVSRGPFSNTQQNTPSFPSQEVKLVALDQHLIIT